MKVNLKPKRTIHFIPYVFLFTFLSFLISAVVESVFNLIHINTNHIASPSVKNSGFIKIIIEGIVIAPLLETFIFQKLIFDFFHHKIRIRFIILLSAAFFGLSHFYDLSYIINTFFIGIILAVAYALWNGKKITPFWTVVTIHLLHNFIILVKEMTT
jgi:membrane protease YdiL (CAAX protease family)